ncbi:MAG: HdeD family acid-resistance protein [Christensenellales bacterium]
MSSIKEKLKKFKWDSIIISVLTIVVGILCVALPAKAGNVLCLVFGYALIVMGIGLIIKYFTEVQLFSERLIIFGILMIIWGIFCLVYPNIIKGAVTVMFGLFIVVDSLSSLSDSIYCARAKVKGWPILLTLSILTIILGISVMFSNFSAVVIYAGISLIVEGVKRLIITLTYSRKIKQAKSTIVNDAIILEPTDETKTEFK